VAQKSAYPNSTTKASEVVNDIDKYTQQVGLALGPEWQFEEKEEKGDHWGCLHTKELNLSVYGSRDPQKYNLHLSLNNELNEHRPCAATQYADIGVARTKTPQQVAGEVRRRLLPQMEETVRKSVLNLIEFNQARKNADRIALLLKEALPTLKIDERNEKLSDSSLSMPYDSKITLDIDVNGYAKARQVEIKVGRVSTEMAVAILKAIGTIGLQVGEDDED